VHVKRIHEYKRQLMNALHLLMIYNELKKNPLARPIKRFSIFGGKAAPGYVMAKNIILFIHCLARKINADPRISHAMKIVFVENYNVSQAEMIIPAADLSEQISTAGMEASGTGNMKLAVSGALTIGTEDGANIEMHQRVTSQWWPFSFGQSSVQNAKLRFQGTYQSIEIYRNYPEIAQALEMLCDRSLVETEDEHQSLVSIYKSLLEPYRDSFPDPYFVLNDLVSYYETQIKVEKLFQRKDLWAQYAIQNIAAMGSFSIDVAVHRYAEQVWDLKPCPADPDELVRVRQEYSEHDRCRIFPR
jgi:glycogen phosphorylase